MPDMLFDAPRQMLLLVAGLAALLVAETWIWHYRSGFPLRTQWLPIVLGLAVALAAVLVASAPTARWSHAALRATGWASALAGVVGVAYHHWYGMVKKAGGYRWWLHSLMYGAPQLAPLALTALGLEAVAASYWMEGRASLLGLPLRQVVLLLVASALAGAALQSAVLHYRGAFNTRAMYAPLVVPPAAALATAWIALSDVEPPMLAGATRGALWLTVLIGFVGLGMHLRGLDRQMGGLHLLRFNVLQGPPAFAPAYFAGVAGIGLVTLGAP